jgi:integrase
VTDALTKPPSSELAALVARAEHYAAGTLADSTIYTMKQYFGIFTRWAQAMGLSSLPASPETVAVFLAALADGLVEARWTDKTGHEHVSKKPHKWSGCEFHYRSIRKAHRDAGLDFPDRHPAILKVLHGIAHRNGKLVRRVKPLELDGLRQVMTYLRDRRIDDLQAARDRVIFTLGFFGALRRSEIVAAKVEDIEFTDAGIVLTIPKSKEDAYAKSEKLAIYAQNDPLVDPVRILKDYLARTELKSGHLVRRIDPRSDCMSAKGMRPESLRKLMKERLEAAGLDPEAYGTHSLRAGFITTAAAQGTPVHRIMRQSRHRDRRVAETYIRPATMWDSNCTDGMTEKEKKR